ncbi:MAG TPA: c-type cytochrome [Vicinamibacterales bacterium]|nr:c-type cytochrome [Vicinamibacterales bacterium]
MTRSSGLALSLACLWMLSTALSAQQAATPPEGGRGRIGAAGIGAYPVRPPGDPAALERGTAVFKTNCAFCHGQDARGGDGGPSLLRSGLVLADQNGELIGPVIEQGRGAMPKFAFKPDQVADLAVFLHSFRVAGYDLSRQKPATIVVGDAKAGEAYFNEACGSCHSASGDLRGIASRIADERVLQQSWLMPGSMTGRGAPPPAKPRPPTVTVTEPGQAPVTGTLGRIDDFVVSLTTSGGEYRSFRITPRTKVEVSDALAPHKDLLRKYTDADIHNVTAFLVTLK